MLADLSFAGEMDLLLEKFTSLKESNDPSVSLIDHIEIKPADIGRVFRTEPDKNKTEVRRGAPVTLRNGKYDMAAEYGDILGNIDGKDILMVADIGSWMMSVTFFKERTTLRKINIDIPDCPGSIAQALGGIADKNVNLISVFSKVKICYQTMYLELVADFADSKIPLDSFEKEMEKAFAEMNGIYTVEQFVELR